VVEISCFGMRHSQFKPQLWAFRKEKNSFYPTQNLWRLAWRSKVGLLGSEGMDTTNGYYELCCISRRWVAETNNGGILTSCCIWWNDMVMTLWKTTTLVRRSWLIMNEDYDTLPCTTWVWWFGIMECLFTHPLFSSRIRTNHVNIANYILALTTTPPGTFPTQPVK
jgi:hypothetical protein